MLIQSKGYGILVFIITFLNSLIMNLIVNAVAGDDEYFDKNLFPLGISFLISAIMLQQLEDFFEQKRKEQKGTRFIDKVTLSRKENSFFFIPFRKWPLILTCAGTGLILYQLFVNKK